MVRHLSVKQVIMVQLHMLTPLKWVVSVKAITCDCLSHDKSSILLRLATLG